MKFRIHSIFCDIRFATPSVGSCDRFRAPLDFVPKPNMCDRISIFIENSSRQTWIALVCNKDTLQEKPKPNSEMTSTPN